MAQDLYTSNSIRVSYTCDSNTTSNLQRIVLQHATLVLTCVHILYTTDTQ